ncbi:MAG TPA: homoserine O-succinyltransferase [Terricaulis sp.]|nr:homoserine O-succinyltransferase [Terricaulis sp.]
MLAEAAAPRADADEDIEIPISIAGERVVRVRLHGRKDGPLIIAAGGISASRRVREWWGGLIYEGGPIDLDRYGVLGFDFAPLEDRRAPLTPHVQAELLLAALDQLGIAQAHAFVGASYGAMVGLALGEIAPERLARLVAISAAHRPAALGRAWRGVQRRIVEDALEAGDGARGLALARQLAMITYRSAEEFEQRFDGALDENGRSDLDKYLVSRGTAYANACAARRWLSLSEAIDRFAARPEAIAVKTTLVACPSDQLAPLQDIEELAARLPQCAGLKLMPSLYGHDAFLKECAQLEAILAEALDG